MKDKGNALAKLAKRKLMVCDTTLRDGEQAAGIVLANREGAHSCCWTIGVQHRGRHTGDGGDEKAAIKRIAHLA